MSTSILALWRAIERPQWIIKPLVAATAVAITGCSSIQAPDALTNLSLPAVSMPNISKFSIPDNDPAFRKRIYAGASVGQSTLSPDTSDTVFTVSDKSSSASQFRLGMDLHNQLSVELNTSVLGKAQIAEGEDTDVSFSGASVSALFYGLSNTKRRSLKAGFSAYGRLGFGIVKHGSIIQPLDVTNNSVILGLGAEYGFANGFSARAEVTRVESDATVLGIGAVYRFGLPPSRIGQIFVNAARPALGAANARTEVRNGKVVRVSPEENIPKAVTGPYVAGFSGKFKSPKQLLQSAYTDPVSLNDTDGDGIADEYDQCQESPANTAVNPAGCGLFDVVLKDVTFKPNSVWLTPRARGQLDSVAITLLAMPESRVLVRAHTDNRGQADANLGLSARRAESVVEYLTEKGVGELQLETKGLGESQPIDTNDTAEGRKANRRVDLKTLANISTDQFSSNSSPSLGAANSAEPTSNSHCGFAPDDCNCDNFCFNPDY